MVGDMIKIKYLILILLVFMMGCATIATQSEDGKTLTLRGIGEAKFQNGASIKGEPIIKLPQIPLEYSP